MATVEQYDIAAYMGADESMLERRAFGGFNFDREKGLRDVHVRDFANKAKADAATGVYQKAKTKLVSFLKATRDALKTSLAKPMTDAETQHVVDVLGRLGLVLEFAGQYWPSGVPNENQVDAYMQEINDLAEKLAEKRRREHSYTGKEIRFDAAKGQEDVHVAEYAKLAAADSSAGTYDASMKKLKSFLKATRDALKKALKSRMSDAQTQHAVGVIGRMNLVLDLTQEHFPEGIPTDAAAAVEDYMGEINDLISQLMQRRKTIYSQVVKERQALSQQIQPGEAPAPSPTYPSIEAGKPTARVTDAAMQQIQPREQPQAVSSADEKRFPVGPTVAVGAGILAAYLALR